MRLNHTIALIGLIGMCMATSGHAADLGRFPVRYHHRSVHAHHHHRHHHYKVSARSCRVGWWQTVVWGSVRPRYAVRCLRFVAREAYFR